MRFVGLYVLLGVLTFQLAQPQGSTVRGTVRVASTSVPIGGASVILMPAAQLPLDQEMILSSLSPGQQMTSYVATTAAAVNTSLVRPVLGGSEIPRSGQPPRTLLTDELGRFEFADVPAGRYIVSVRREGYFNSGIGGSAAATTTPFEVPLTLSGIQVDLALVHGGVISGRVFDPTGQPVAGIQVAAYQRRYINGRTAISGPIASKTTDNRGEFRIFWLAPGDYWVGASPQRAGSVSLPTSSWARTFSPATRDPFMGTSVTVKENGEIPNVDIQIRTVSGVSLSGRVNSSLSEAGGRSTAVGTAYLLPLDPSAQFEPGALTFPNSAEDKADGQFKLLNVPPGRYDLIATIPDAQGRLSIGRTLVDVRNEDLKEVAINIHPGVPVSSRIRYSGGTIADWPLRLRLIPSEFDVSPFNAALSQPILTRISPDGTATPISSNSGQVVQASDEITFSNVPPGTYVFEVTGMPPNSYIEDVREGGVSVYDSGLRVGTAPPNPVEVRVNLSAESLEGIVTDSNRLPVPFAAVVMAPQLERRSNSSLFKVGLTGPDGRFKLDSIAPGRYVLFSWKSGLPANAYLSSEFMSQFEGLGLPITIDRSARPSLNLTVIDR